MNDSNDQEEREKIELEIPPELVNDLAALFDRTLDIPPDIDAGIREAAWLHFASRRRQLRPLVRWIAPLAAAATVLVVVLSVMERGSRSTLAPTSLGEKEGITGFAGDFNHDGRIDIVDALALAQGIERGDKIGTQWDANGDGTVDERDADALGQNAVALF